MKKCPKCNADLWLAEFSCWNCGHNLMPESGGEARVSLALSDWVGQLEAALCMVTGWREDADEESAPVYCGELDWLTQTLRKAIETERGRCPTAQAQRTGTL